LLDKAIIAVGAASDRWVIASNDPTASEWFSNAVIVRDVHPGTGGLAGVEAAFKWAGRRDLVVAAWDMPFVSGALLVSLMDFADKTGADAVVPQSDSPHGFEPFCAFYSHRVRKPLFEFLSAGGGAAHEFLRSLPKLHLVPTHQVAWSGDPKRLLFSVNTPEDLERAHTMLAASK
jgi:molybdopterin-guanine dinucleotide biosynthesis protein A